MRIIDADALKETFCAECNHTISCEDCDIDFHFEHLAPTVTPNDYVEKISVDIDNVILKAIEMTLESIDAIPIAWLEDQAKDTPYQHRVEGLIARWRREHE